MKVPHWPSYYSIKFTVCFIANPTKYLLWSQNCICKFSKVTLHSFIINHCDEPWCSYYIFNVYSDTHAHALSCFL